MTIEEMRDIIAQVKFEDYTFVVTEGHGGIYLQAHYPEGDIVTKLPSSQYSRKWLLSPLMTKSELVQTAFKLCITSMEHRTREHFLYKGKRVFGPHFDVEALWQICQDKRLDYRKDEA